MRKILAILVTIITIFVIKETIYIFTTTDAEIIRKKAQYSIAATSLMLPLVLLSLWLWISKKHEQ